LLLPVLVPVLLPAAAAALDQVHVHPKRFPAAYSVDWRQCVLADRPEYVVVDKPAGVQVSNMRTFRHHMCAAGRTLPCVAALGPCSKVP
jgi:hypothetical protein